jgi:hypothetical protein
MTRRYCAVLTSALSALACTGCVNYNWEQNIERAEQRAKAEKKYLFVYYWKWLDNDSNRMFSDVLNQTDVARLFQNTINAQVAFEVSAQREYMARHGVERTPGFIIQAPDGSYQKLAGYVPKEAFINWAQASLTKTAASERPAQPPAITPIRAP